VRLRVEFTTEPFDLDEVPEHAEAARAAVSSAGLDAVEVGPFGNSAEGSAGEVLAAVRTVLDSSLRAGATRISLQVSVVPGTSAPSGPPGPATGTESAPDDLTPGAGRGTGGPPARDAARGSAPPATGGTEGGR
jgi:uncharacterized protein YqgV (UPF0045/DUF77 family)